MLEEITLGIIQGIAEWLPVSSEGMIVLTKTNLFPPVGDFQSLIDLALFLHLGTFAAALIYFWKDVVVLTKGLFAFKEQPKENQNVIQFLVLATIISMIIGGTLILTIDKLTQNFEETGKTITFLVGCLLLVTAYLEIKAHKGGERGLKDITVKDGVVLGITQGFAALPGLSRSGLTVSVLLLRKLEKVQALKLSFLMSLPIVLIGNIIRNADLLLSQTPYWSGLICSFVFGLISIHLLLKVAEKIQFGYLLLAVGLLTIGSTFLPSLPH